MSSDYTSNYKALQESGKLNNLSNVVNTAITSGTSVTASGTYVPGSSFSTGDLNDYTTTDHTFIGGPIQPNVTPNIQWTYEEVLGKQETSGQDLVGMLIEGKDLVENKEEFMDVIMRLPSVNGDNLKAVEVYERLRKLSQLINITDLEK